jgi:hypothetical protein
VTQETTAQDAQEQDTNLLAALDMASLRKAAKLLGISAQRDWGKEDFVKAIQDKQANTDAELALLNANAPKPGYARILIHRDPTPGHKNTPVHVVVNGRIFAIPRGLEMDVPRPIMEALANAITIVTRQKESGHGDGRSGAYVDEPQLSYPFQVIAITPGEYVNPNDGRRVSYERRLAFHTKFGRWPTHGELQEAMKIKMQKDLAED